MLICHSFFDISNFLSLTYQLQLILVTLQTSFLDFSPQFLSFFYVNLGSTSYLGVFCPLSIWHWEAGHLVEAVTLEEAFKEFLFLSPHCPVSIPACLFSVQLTADGFQYWPPRGFYLGSTKAQLWWHTDGNRCKLPPKSLSLLMIPGEYASFQGIFSLKVKDGDIADLQLPGSKVGMGTASSAMFTSSKDL